MANRICQGLSGTEIVVAAVRSVDGEEWLAPRKMDLAADFDDLLIVLLGLKEG